MTPLPYDKVTAAAPLVTMTDAKAHLRIPVDDVGHDADVTLKLAQATDVILDYLTASADPAWTVATVPLPVQAAILIMLTHLYEDRGDRAKDTDADADDTVWKSIDRYLARFRDPSWA